MAAPAGTPAPGVPTPPPPGYTTPMPNTPPPMSAQDQATEMSGLGRAKLAAICALLGLALGILGPWVVGSSIGLGFGLGAPSISTGAVQSYLNGLELLVLLAVVGVLLTLIAFVLYTISFATLRRVDRRFSAPMALCVVGLVGLLLAVGGVLLALLEIFSFVSCGGGASCAVPALVTPVLLVLGGLLLGFIGWIGLILGLYRIGSRYDSGVTKIGAILAIIPVVNIVSPILILVGIHGVEGRLRAQRGMAA